jgi:hypothetical protein
MFCDAAIAERYVTAPCQLYIGIYSSDMHGKFTKLYLGKRFRNWNFREIGFKYSVKCGYPHLFNHFWYCDKGTESRAG